MGKAEKLKILELKEKEIQLKYDLGKLRLDKDMMVVNQLKKCTKHEIKECFLDKWPNFKSLDELIELSDTYEDVWKGSCEKNMLKKVETRKVWQLKTL